jgi:regulator of cell morphogenesis and NO signaling
MLVQKENTIGEVVAGNFLTARIFSDYGLDFCCGGKKTIQDACKEKGINPDALINSLLTQGSVKTAAHFDKWELDFLIDYIITNHHSYVSSGIHTIEHLFDKVISKHGEKHPELLHMNSLFTELKEELFMHMQKEEKLLFPYIKKMLIARNNSLEFPYPPFGTVTSPIAVIESEHEKAGALMHEINMISDGYTSPADGCTSFRVLYSELEAFEADLHIHVHLENNILFPKAIELEKSFSINN